MMKTRIQIEQEVLLFLFLGLSVHTFHEHKKQIENYFSISKILQTNIIQLSALYVSVINVYEV